MKKLFIIAIAILSAQFISAQRFSDDQQTVFGKKRGFGAYLGLNSKLTEINDQNALMTGIEGTFVINHSLNIGVEGYGLATTVRSNSMNLEGNRRFIGTGYGGLKLEPVLWSEKVIHLTLPVSFGAGGISEFEKDYTEFENFEDHDWDIDKNDFDMFLYIEPGINAEVNLFRMLRLAGGVSYRFTDGLEITGLDSNSMSGYNINLSLRFGWF